MASDQPVTGAGLDSGFGSYLAELATALPGPRRRRAAVLAEVHDGLCEAAERHLEQGLTADQARQAARDEFGAPSQLAAGFAGELAAARARQIVTALLATGPMVGVWWLLLLAPTSWWQNPNPTDLWTAIPVLPLVGAAVLAGLAILATTGQLTRWLPETAPARALTAARVIALACAGIDLTMLTILAFHVVGDGPTRSPVIAAAAVLASVIRLAYATRIIHVIRNRHTEMAERRGGARRSGPPAARPSGRR